jgi:hypothetical protein
LICFLVSTLFSRANSILSFLTQELSDDDIRETTYEVLLASLFVR